MERIRCPIHSDIQVDEIASELIDTKEFQRLRRIKQLGTAYLVYPGANHTRFEHSLGVYFLARECCRSLQLKEDEKKITIAALLHDIGHGPFSHLVEEVIGNQHEKATEDIIKKTEIREVISKNGITPNEVIELIKGRGIGAIISSELDVDRMDYLVRDAHYTGVSIGVELKRLIATMKFQNGKLLISENGLNAAEVLLFARFVMYPVVYFHRTTRIAEKMLVKASEKAIKEGYFSKEKFQKMDDAELMLTLKNSKGFAKEIAEKVENRELFKLCLELKYDKLKDKKLAKNKNQIIKLENEIAKELKVNEGEVIIDIPEKPILEEINANILLANGKIEKISNISKLVSILADAQLDHWKIRVYTIKEKRVKGMEVARMVLKC